MESKAEDRSYNFGSLNENYNTVSGEFWALTNFGRKAEKGQFDKLGVTMFWAIGSLFLPLIFKNYFWMQL